MKNKLPFLPDDHHYAITNVVGRAAQLDHHIEMTIAGLMTKNTATFILKQFGHDRLLGLLRALTLDQFPEHTDDLGWLIDEIIRLRKERNNIMHWLWGNTDNPEEISIQSMRPYRDNPQPEIKTADEIQKIADEMLSCSQRLLIYLDLTLRRHGLKPLTEKPVLETLVQQACQERLASQEILDGSSTQPQSHHGQLPAPK